jgi:predicted adenine nucleotide alpha hydrolase (AANH) superfamily ATPase
VEKERFLLHICCAPCSPFPVRKLKAEYAVELYFYNPNIHPEAEYFARLEEAEKFASIENIPLFKGPYRHEEWSEKARIWKDEDERGLRCKFCISDRMRKSARKSSEIGIKRFGTVLSLSRLKSTAMINSLGRHAMADFDELVFDETDWKKKEGFNISAKISAELGLKRQDYCGCEYSFSHRKIAPGAIAANSIPTGEAKGTGNQCRP